MENNEVRIKGRYESLVDLCKDHPIGADGDIYLVKSTKNGLENVYKWSKVLKSWVDHGFSEESQIKRKLEIEQANMERRISRSIQKARGYK